MRRVVTAVLLVLALTACSGTDSDPAPEAAPSVEPAPTTPAPTTEPPLTLVEACPKVKVALDDRGLRTYTDVKEFQVAFDRIRAESDADTSDALDLLNQGVQDLKNALLLDAEGADLRRARASFSTGVARLSALCESVGSTVLA